MSLLMPWRRAQLVATAMGFTPADVPQSEANALIAFYHATHGDAWTTNTNWLVDPVVNNWAGVTVAGGHVTSLQIATNNLVGAAGATLDPLAGSLVYLYVNNNGITTLSVSALTKLTFLRVYANTISVLDLSKSYQIQQVYCNLNSISTLDLSGLHNAIGVIDVGDNGMAQAAVDSMISDIWTRRADWTDATPELRTAGTNAAPTGAYADDNEATGLGKVFSLINDPDAVGFRKWAAISWNGGSAP